MENVGIVSALNIYPLKSAKGISVKSLEIFDKGPQWDREWMLVDKNNSFVSQRLFPRMGLIETQITPSHLVCSTKNFESLSIDLEDFGHTAIEAKLFAKPVTARLISTQMDQWFSDFLGAEVRLVRAPREVSRQTSGRNGPATPVQFADGYPILLTNTATLEALNKRLDKAVSMDRFRPNIVVSQVPKDQEDQWTEVKIGSAKFLSVKACTRCVVINRDPESGIISKDVTKTLKEYRTKDGAVIFGTNLSHTQIGTIEVGNTIWAR